MTHHYFMQKCVHVSAVMQWLRRRFLDYENPDVNVNVNIPWPFCLLYSTLLRFIQLCDEYLATDCGTYLCV